MRGSADIVLIIIIVVVLGLLVCGGAGAFLFRARRAAPVAVSSTPSPAPLVSSGTAADAAVSPPIALREAAPRAGDAFRVTARTVLSHGEPGAAPDVETVVETIYVVRVREVSDDGESVSAEVAFERDRVTTREGERVSVEEEQAHEPFAFRGSRTDLSLARLRGRAADRAPAADLASLALRREAVAVGEEWSQDTSVQVAGLPVLVRQSYRVASRDEQGRLAVQMQASGEAPIGATGARLFLVGSGYAIVRTDAIDRPDEIAIDYHWVARGGGGADAESRFTLSVATENVP